MSMSVIALIEKYYNQNYECPASCVRSQYKDGSLHVVVDGKQWDIPMSPEQHENGRKRWRLIKCAFAIEGKPVGSEEVERVEPIGEKEAFKLVLDIARLDFDTWSFHIVEYCINARINPYDFKPLMGFDMFERGNDALSKRGSIGEVLASGEVELLNQAVLNSQYYGDIYVTINNDWGEHMVHSFLLSEFADPIVTVKFESYLCLGCFVVKEECCCKQKAMEKLIFDGMSIGSIIASSKMNFLEIVKWFDDNYEKRSWDAKLKWDSLVNNLILSVFTYKEFLRELGQQSGIPYFDVLIALNKHFNSLLSKDTNYKKAREKYKRLYDEVGKDADKEFNAFNYTSNPTLEQYRAASTLDIAIDATKQQIKKAYKKMSLKFHPDRGGDAVQFNKIKEAYDVLMTSYG